MPESRNTGATESWIARPTATIAVSSSTRLPLTAQLGAQLFDQPARSRREPVSGMSSSTLGQIDAPQRGCRRCAG
jgi:hypothetical protein